MTARYAPAACLSALLHAAVIAMLVWFALAARHEPEAMPRLGGPLFDVVNTSAAPAQTPDNIQVVIPRMPPRATVPEEPTTASALKNEPAVVRPREPVKPKAGPMRVAATPSQNVKPSVKPGRTPPPTQVAPVRVDTKWGDTSAAPTRSDVPPVARDMSLEQNVPELEAYFAELRERLKAALQVPPGLRAELIAKVEFVLKADGTLLRPRIVAPSGSADFDRAVMEAVLRTRMPARPDGRTETLMFPFATELKAGR